MRMIGEVSIYFDIGQLDGLLDDCLYFCILDLARLGHWEKSC